MGARSWKGGKGQGGGLILKTRKLWGDKNFCILIVVLFEQPYSSVQTHQVVPFKKVNDIVYKL